MSEAKLGFSIEKIDIRPPPEPKKDIAYKFAGGPGWMLYHWPNIKIFEVWRHRFSEPDEDGNITSSFSWLDYEDMPTATSYDNWVHEELYNELIEEGFHDR